MTPLQIPHCPECNSANIRLRKKDRIYICSKCKNKFWKSEAVVTEIEKRINTLPPNLVRILKAKNEKKEALNL